MSLQYKKYNLNPGPFGLCSKIWDEDSQTFKKANKTETGDCCLYTCKPTVDQCVKYCHESNNTSICYKTCTNIKELCETNCQLSTELLGYKNPIFKGTDAFGCGNKFEQTIDKNCILKNKDNILKICQNNCLPTSDIDCYKHCEYSFNTLASKHINPLYFDEEPTQSILEYQSEENMLKILIFIIIGMLAFLTLGIYILFL